VLRDIVFVAGSVGGTSVRVLRFVRFASYNFASSRWRFVCSPGRAQAVRGLFAVQNGNIIRVFETVYL